MLPSGIASYILAAKPLPSFLIPHSYEAFIPIKGQYTLNPEP